MTGTGPTSPYFTLQEAAAFARCSTRTILRWLKDEKLTRYGLHRPLISIEQLEGFLSPTKTRMGSL